MNLRYGTNPHQAARISGDEHIRVVHGSPSLINYLDALNAWQLVAQAHAATGTACAASFKHVSPAGAALAGELDETLCESWDLDPAALSPVATAYLRARDADPRSSYGDMIAVSEPVDLPLAELLASVVSDGIIAPGYAPGTVAALSRKKSGRFVVFDIDPHYRPPAREVRTVFGVTLEQDHDAQAITADLLQVTAGRPLDAEVISDALLGMITARYTQSNSVVYVRDRMTIGIGAGQQSRIDCTRLAGDKARTWWTRRHPTIRTLPLPATVSRRERSNWQVALADGSLTPAQTDQLRELLTGPCTLPGEPDRAAWARELTGTTLVSDGYLPFRDNIDVAAARGVETVVEPGGSLRSDDVATACREHGITLVRTGTRLFHH